MISRETQRISRAVILPSGQIVVNGLNNHASVVFRSQLSATAEMHKNNSATLSVFLNGAALVLLPGTASFVWVLSKELRNIDALPRDRNVASGVNLSGIVSQCVLDYARDMRAQEESVVFAVVALVARSRHSWRSRQS